MQKTWFLEGVATDGSRVIHPLKALPFRVGRDVSNDLAVDGRGLSRMHAEFRPAGDGKLLLTDLGSTNGTHVNHERIRGAMLVDESDVIHFGNAEFRLGADTPTTLARHEEQRTQITAPGAALSQRFVRQERRFMELLRGEGLSAAAQPIVDAASGHIFAYELLGRCTHPELPSSPIHLFHMAALLDREAELSEAFRAYGVQALTPRLQGGRLFVNTHPRETFAESFFSALKALQARPGTPELVVEVHETAVVEVVRMKELAARLADIGVRFAYDDFGAGQARFNELGEVPAHFVKFDMGLVRGLHEASERKQKLVRDLVRMVLDLGSVPLAEGVETEAEATICRDMGFQLVQGYLTGRPMPVSAV